MNTSDLTFRVAGALYRIQGTDGLDLRRLLPSSAPFYESGAADDEPCMFTLTLCDDLGTETGDAKELGQFDCGGANHGVWALQGAGEDCDGCYHFHISTVDGRLACIMENTPRFERVRVRLLGSEKDQRFGLNNALMIAFAFSGAHRGIVLMHSSVVVFQGRGYMFLGKSGTGKSTHTGLWLRHIEGTHLLNDDNPAVRIEADGCATVYGTPWSGKTHCYRQEKVPVGAIVRLEQWPANLIEREAPLRGFASVLSSCSAMIWDKPSYDAIIKTSTAITRAVGLYHLRCLPDRQAALLSRQTIAPSL